MGGTRVTFFHACSVDIKTLKSRIDIMFGFELLWKIVILVVVVAIAYALYFENEEQKRRDTQKLLAKHRILTKMIPDFVFP